MGLQFRLSDETGSLGLSCAESGVSLAGAPLLRKTALGFASRSKAEIGALMKAAYGDAFCEMDLSRRLAVVADALNKGDLGRAKIAAVQMRLPALRWDRAARIARTEEVLRKYDPDEPRDWRGRWTNTYSDAPPNPATAPLRPQPQPTPPRRNRTPDPESDPIISESGPAHLYGGHLIHTGGWPENEPVEPIPIPEAEPDVPGVRVPQGWDTPSETIGGLTYPSTRRPTLTDGKPWPIATHDAVRAALEPIPGRLPPTMVIYIPDDGRGPMLIGETDKEDFAEPKGYSPVRLIGTPQRTYFRGEETGHAGDSIQQALAFAGTNQFSEIYFNRALVTSTRGAIESNARPDVIAIIRPEIESGYIYYPYESLSPGQDREEDLREREGLFSNLPGMAPLRSQRYKFVGLMISPHYRVLG